MKRHRRHTQNTSLKSHNETSLSYQCNSTNKCVYECECDTVWLNGAWITGVKKKNHSSEMSYADPKWHMLRESLQCVLIHIRT